MNFDLFGARQVEKTERLGIPYMGSKRKHADKLIDKILELKPNAKYFYDLFGGGGAMSFAALQKGMTVFYNEKQTDLVRLMEYVFECVNNPKSEYGIFPAEYYHFITRDEFIRLKEESGTYAQFARICYSFGNNQRTYLFNKELEVTKMLSHNVVVFRDAESLRVLRDILGVELSLSDAKTINERRLDFRKTIRKSMRLDLQQLQQLQQLERLQQLQQLEQLERLERLEQKITFTNLDYRDVKITTPIDETVVYLDPPYRGTEKYIEGIDHDGMDEFFRSLPYLAFMSEYNAPFNCILDIKTTSTLSDKVRSSKIERLYVNK